MYEAGHLSGGAGILKKYKVGASFSNPGLLTRFLTTNPAGLTPVTTTTIADSAGLALDTVTYAATDTDVEDLVTVSTRPDLIVGALMSGGATEGTALTLLSNTSADTTGLTITDGDVGANDMTGGTIWRYQGGIGGESRHITTHTGSTSMAVTRRFLQTIAASDEFLFCPWSLMGDGASGFDGVGNVQPTTNLYQADASIASGTGLAVVVYDLILRGRDTSHVLFVVQDHQYRVNTN